MNWTTPPCRAEMVAPQQPQLTRGGLRGLWAKSMRPSEVFQSNPSKHPIPIHQTHIAGAMFNLKFWISRFPNLDSVLAARNHDLHSLRFLVEMIAVLPWLQWCHDLFCDFKREKGRVFAPNFRGRTEPRNHSSGCPRLPGSFHRDLPRETDAKWHSHEELTIC